ncbi:MAG TPA: c-type cytochrome [Burkholderiales bacterium]|nr:c-type cytochrome [Burkholderiales bacterium]
MKLKPASILFAAFGTVATVMTGCGGGSSPSDSSAADRTALVAQGQQTFRFDTFGDESKWTDVLQMQTVVSSVSPATALSVGLKVDADAIPASLAAAIKAGQVDLNDPANTVALVKLNAVIGVKGTVESINGQDKLTRVGFTCALCHSTVDNSFSAGIGKRLDGWPNRDLNVGLIVSLSPNLQPLADALGTDVATVKTILTSWGPGKYDPRLNFDGQNGPTVIPPAYGLAGINSITYTGDGTDIQYWNRYVAVTQMGGHGSFSDARIGVNVTNGTDDLVSSKLEGLQAYQLSLAAPTPPAGSFDAAAAARGKLVFETQGGCATCHSGAEFTDANTHLHLPRDSMAEPETPSYAARSATKLYRTSPLKGVWQHAPYFHNGSAATLADVVNTYNTKLGLGLSAPQMADLVEYLKSL